MTVRLILAALLSLALVGCETTQTAMNEAKQAISRKNVVEVAAEDGQFSTLVTAIRAAGLDTTLSEKGPFTIFAPTDDAFSSMPDGGFAKLVQDKARLAELLKYHVVPAELTSDKLFSSTVTTLSGHPITIRVDGKNITVDGAHVTRTDIFARNGVIFAIDRVLTPPSN
ncbi:MAG: fasciclin domain-containing protein [Betaproteobacteria bacterium]|nr:fasciclin domain-containing protein [Betaproteobacteria bacterium]